MLIFFLFVRLQNLLRSYCILILLHEFATLISFLRIQENKFFPCHPGWAFVFIPESTVSSSSVGYLYESADPIMEHVVLHDSEGKLKGARVVFPPLHKKCLAVLVQRRN